MKPFQSDPDKEATNIHKHHVEFRNAIRAIHDKHAIKYYDVPHSGFNNLGIWEDRWIAIGKAGKRILFVSYTIRNHEIRIISARRANKRERHIYRRSF